MRTLFDDIRFGVRLVVKNPLAALSVVVVLALGIGANTAIFTIVDAVLIRPLPYKNPDRLVMVWESEPQLPRAPVTGPDFQDWKKMSHSFEQLAAGTSAFFNLTGSGEPLRLEGWSVSPDVFSLLGVHAALGRTFQAEEDQPGRNRVAVLSYGLWQRAFGGDRTLVGRDITLDGQNYTVAGIMPAQFRFPGLWGIKAEVFVPLSPDDPSLKWLKERGNHGIWVMGRMKPDVSIEQADAEMKTINKQLEKAYPDSNDRIGASVVGLHQQLTNRTRSMLIVLLIAVGFVLAIACANVANLMIAQSTRRQREMGIRLALGATRYRILRQMLTESVVLSCLGAGVGLLLAVWLQSLLLKLGPAGYVPNVIDVSFSRNVFVFAAALAVLTGVLSGLAPAWQASRTEINDTVKEGARAAGSTRSRLRNVLIVGEVASALVLLFGAGLTIRSLQQLLNQVLGFDPNGVLTMKVSLPDQRYPKPENVVQFYQRTLEAVRAVPGVQAAGFAALLPLEGGNNGTIRIEGQPRNKGWGGQLVEHNIVMPGYFQTMRVPVLAGRDINDADIGRPVALINNAMAKHFWPNQNPIGKRFGYNSDDPEWVEVVGVVADISEWGLDRNIIPQQFRVMGEKNARSSMGLVLRTSLPPESLAKETIAAIHSVDKDLPVFDVRPMQQILDLDTGERRFTVFLMALFAGLALILACVGIYGVMSYLVAQRTQEIGVRIALGASASDVVGMVLGQSMKLIGIGLAIGVAGALASAKVMTSLLFHVSPRDPVTIVSISALLAVVALLASYLPARRATKVDPMVALRYE